MNDLLQVWDMDFDWEDVDIPDGVDINHKKPEDAAKLDHLSDADKQKLANREIFVWYFDEFLTAMVGSTSWWSIDKRGYNLLTDKTTVNGHEYEKPCVSVAMEAFALVALENNRELWKWQFAMKKNDCKANINITKEMRDKYPNLPDTMYSDKKKGQQRFGTWSDPGLKRWEELKKIIKIKRKNDRRNGKKVQKMAKKLIRLKYKLNQDCHELEGKKSTRANDRNNDSGNPIDQQLNLSYGDDDESEDEENRETGNEDGNAAST